MSVPVIPVRDLEAIYRRRDWSAVSAYVRPDPATGGVIGISIMVGVAALLGGMLACGGIL